MHLSLAIPEYLNQLNELENAMNLPVNGLVLSPCKLKTANFIFFSWPTIFLIQRRKKRENNL
jgi:hypothetical protein